MAKILHSQNFIRFVISQKNKIDYLKNGGGYMANTKIFREDTRNLFDELTTFFREQEEKEQEDTKEANEICENKKEDETFSEKKFLEQELDDALENFNLAYATKIKEKLNALKEDEKKVEQESFVIDFTNLKDKNESEVRQILSDGIKDENYSKKLVDFLVGIVKNG